MLYYSDDDPNQDFDTLDGDVEGAARGTCRRRVGALEVGPAVHAVPAHRHDHHLRGGALRRTPGGRQLEGLLEGVGHHPVDRADAHPDPGDRAAGSAAMDRLQDALAVAHLVHAGPPYIDRMRR